MNNKKKVVSIALATILLGGTSAGAITDNDNTDYYTYIVQDGDTLGKIVNDNYGSVKYCDAVAEYNNLENPDLIYTGDVINIPKELSYDYKGNTIIVKAYEPDKFYTIKPNDTLYDITKEIYGVNDRYTVDKLATYNDLFDPNYLYIDQVLSIPCKEKLEKVVPNDYTEAYRFLEWRMNHRDEYDCNYTYEMIFEKYIEDVYGDFEAFEHCKCLSKIIKHCNN